MNVEAIELRQLEIPMVEPLASAHGVTRNRLTVLVHVMTDVGEGWGECVALNEPTYSSDWSNGEYNILRELFGPLLLRADGLDAQRALRELNVYRGHHPAKASIEMALLDAQLRAEGRSLKSYFGTTATEVDSCVVVGLSDPATFMRAVESKVQLGYRYLKIKIAPGDDVDRVDMVQQSFPELVLRVDANASYRWCNPEHRSALLELDSRGLALIEQPHAPDDYRSAVAIKETLKTPIGVDESVTSYERALVILEVAIADVLTVKPGMLGGYSIATDVHDHCVQKGAKMAVGGMIETGLASAANLALAGLPGFTHPAEIAQDGRWFEERINQEPIVLKDGKIEIPDRPGVGVTVDPQFVNRLTRRMHVLRRS